MGRRKTKLSLHAMSSMELTAATAGLDIASDNILRNREVLAILLQSVVEEFRNCSQEEVMQCIDPDSIQRTEASAGRTNNAIHGDATEFKILNEKLATFDIRFKAINPKADPNTLNINLHFDVEPQKNYRPGYPIEKRANMYVARDLSSQIPLLTEDTNYNYLEKCYSIWICRDNIPQSERMSISFIGMRNYKNVGDTSPLKEDYDLMEIIIIRLGDKNYATEEKGLFDFLTALFYPHKEDFIERMKKYFDFETNLELAKEVTYMTGLGESILEEGREEGRKEGREQGIKAIILDNIEDGKAETVIIEKLKKRFQLNEEEANYFYKKYRVYR